MTTRPPTRAHFNQGDTMMAVDWNTYVRQQKLYVQERMAGTNVDKSPVSAISGLTGFYWNYLVNGGMEIWTKGAGPFTASGTHALPGWTFNLVGTAPTGNVQRVASLESGLYAAQVTFSGGSASPSAQLVQTVENPYQYAGRTLTVQARVQGNVTNACYVQLGAWNGVPGVGTLTAVNSSRNAVANALTTLTASINVPSGTNIQQVYCVLIVDVVSAVVLDSMMLAMSSTAIPFIPGPAVLERDRAKRRMQQRYPTVRFPASAGGQTRDITFPLPVEMCNTPTAFQSAGLRNNLSGTPTIATVTSRSFRMEILSAAAGDTYAASESVRLEATPP